MNGPPSEEPVGLQLTRTARDVGRAFDEALAGGGASLPQWLVLVSLKARRHGMQRDLAQELGIEGPTLTHHLNRMEFAGLVTRRRDPDNRRVHQVELTEEGEAAFARLLGVVIAFDAQLRAGLTDVEISALRAALQRLRTNVAGSSAAEQEEG